MKPFLPTFLFVLSSMCFSTSYGQIYAYTSDTSGAYNSIASNATGIKLTRYNGTNRPASPCATGFSSTNFSTTATSYASTLQAIEADVTASAGYLLSVTGFSVGLRRSGTGPANARLAYSIDGGATWIDKGSDDTPNNGSCGTTTTASWTTSVIVPSSSTLKFRVYGFNASNVAGTMQILNMDINGTVVSADSVFTTASSFGPFCENNNDTISVPFTTAGTFTGPFYVQLSDASGIFPNDATSNLISSGTTTSPATGVIPAATAWANGYRVRVVNQNPTYYTSGDNGSNIVINHTVVPAVIIIDSPTAVCSGSPISFSIDTSSDGGISPTYQWYVNNTATGTNDTYISSTLSNNDSVYVLMTSNAQCASPSSAASNTIHVTIYSPQTSSVYDTLCPGGSISFGGTTQTTSGNYTIHLSTVNSCDSAVTLHLTVLNTHRDTLTASICQGSSYPFNGVSYSAAGTYSDSIRCDSIVTLVLNYKSILRDTVTASICQGDNYPFNGVSYSVAGTYSDSIRCDSIVTLVLNYKNILRDTIGASICQGDNYPFNGVSYSVAGAYSDSIRCDSIVTLVLNYKAIQRDTVTAGICQGDSYSFNGASYSAPGAYSDTLSCDSIATLQLIVHSRPTAIASLTGSDQLSTTTFATYQWLLNGSPVSGATSQNYTAIQNGQYSVAVSDANGCTDTSATIPVILIGITEPSHLNARIYPSPSNGIINIDAEGLSHVEVIDVIGRSVLSTSVSNGSSHSQIDISGYAEGMYTLILRGMNNAVAIKNIVKQ